MRVIAVALAFLMAGVSALPNRQSKELESAIRSGESRLVTGNIISAIEDLAQSIADAGLDPFIIDKVGVDYAAPVPSVFNSRAHIHGLRCQGLSNIVVNRMNYAVITSRLTFNIELPLISCELDDSAYEVNILSGKLSGKIRGRFVVRSIVMTGDIRVNVGIISGISIRSMGLTYSMGGIESDMKIQIQDKDISAAINDFWSRRVPHALDEFESDINQLITVIARQIAEENL